MPALASPSVHLTFRDMAIVEMVYRFGGCTIEHVHARLWSEDTALSSCYRRIARLVATRYLLATRLPSLTGQGSGRTFLTIGPASRPLIAKLLGVPLASLPRSSDVATPLFLAHHFAICDFRVALELATDRDPEVALIDWTIEAEFKRSPTQVTDTYIDQGKHRSRIITLIPDGGFTLSYQGATKDIWFEQDMGTITPKRLALKLRGYLIRQAKLPGPVFFVTSRESRAAQVVDLARREAELLRADPTIFFITTQEHVTKDTILLAPVWQQPAVERRVAIIPASTPTSAPPHLRLLRPSSTSSRRLSEQS